MTANRALDWLHPVAPDPVRMLRPVAALDAPLLRDGLLVEVWPGVLRAGDLAPGLPERVAAVAPLVPPGAVLARQSAVWAYSGSFRPQRLDVVLTRRRHRSTARVQVHAERLDADDVVPVGRGALTGVARTAVDVARREPGGTVASWLEALTGLGLDPADVEAALRRAAGLPGVVRARDVLAQHGLTS